MVGLTPGPIPRVEPGRSEPIRVILSLMPEKLFQVDPNEV